MEEKTFFCISCNRRVNHENEMCNKCKTNLGKNENTVKKHYKQSKTEINIIVVYAAVGFVIGFLFSLVSCGAGRIEDSQSFFVYTLCGFFFAIPAAIIGGFITQKK